MNDTIAAISTAFGEGAIALLRMSGPEAIAIADAVYTGRQRPSELASRLQQFGQVRANGEKVDDVLLSVHRAPASYTGEDVVEIGCHGGILISRRILELLLRSGARSANPGEFTQRAYLNGKMDLTQAEAVMDLISAQTDLALKAASEQLEGKLGERVRIIRDRLIEVLAHIEAYIDFPDEDIDPETGEALQAKLEQVCEPVQTLLATAGQGRILREGVRTVIFGAPNVGKSSLLNLLLGTERAIVSARPGTTRDVIEEVINLRGIPLRLIDTAGVRESDDEIEKEGIERTRQQLAKADLVLHVVDASVPLKEAAETFDRIDNGTQQTLRVLNKVDLGEHPSWSNEAGVRLSCLKHTGLDDLSDAISGSIMQGGSHRDWSLAINARHQACLEQARAFLDAGQEGLRDGLSPEFVAEELRGALEAIGDIVGRVDHEEILGKIFSTFCIGK